MSELPLKGIRIIDGGEIWAGPYACALLADMGAEVIKVEAIQRFQAPTRGESLHPRPGDPRYPNRDPGRRPWDRTASHNTVNRNKLGITLDLTRPHGVALYKRLVKVSDVVIENFGAGVIERLGLGYQVLKEVNPQIIMLSSSIFGFDGPYKGYIGFGSIPDALTGHVSLRGYPGDDVTNVNTTVQADAVAAVHGAFAVLAALRYRARTGKGQFIDLSQAESFMPHLGEFIMDYSLNKRVAGTLGNASPFGAAPHGCYPCRGHDRWVTIAAINDAQWQGLCEAMGHLEWTKDERFADGFRRGKHQEELNELLTAWTSQHDEYEIMHCLQAAGVPAAPVLNDAQLLTEPQLLARGFFETIDHREAGRITLPGVAWKSSKTPGRIYRGAPCLGEHNEEVLVGLLGLTIEELTELEVEQIIGTEFLPGSDR